MQHELLATLATEDGWPARVLLEEKDKTRHWEKWRRKFVQPSDLINKFNFRPPESEFTILPRFSFLLCVPFRLEKPYISKDERDFYLLDNPLRKERIFQQPMVAASGWKGALRAALWQLDYKDEHEITVRLFGNPRASEEGRAGRLHFYSTFFDKMALEVVNPHQRQTGIGKRGPILMECVPKETAGELAMLYVPFGPIKQADDKTCVELAQDLEVVTKGIRAMLMTYGFGAKTSSGFGTVENKLAGKGRLLLRAEVPGISDSTATESKPRETVPDLPRYLETPKHLQSDFRQADGSLKSEPEYEALVKSQGGKYGKSEKQLYEKARKWWERIGSQFAEAADEERVPEKPAPPVPASTTLTFSTLGELCDVAQRVSDTLLERR
jgi:CRISPR-associated protein Cmr2